MSACRALSQEDRVKMGLGWHRLAVPGHHVEKGVGLPEGSLKDSAGLEVGKSSVFFPLNIVANLST